MSDENSKNNNVSSDITGRKIFFLFPTNSIQNHIMNELVQQEYEVYTAKDHSRLLRSLKKMSDSVVFINMDEGMAASEWEKWISGIKSACPKLDFGVFSSKPDDELRDRMIKSSLVTCGFFALKHDMSKCTEPVIENLIKVNVKGRRKYLRAALAPDANAVINIPHNGEYINGVLKDISVVGVSCVFEQDPNYPKNTLLSDIQLRLQSQLLRVESVVFGSREGGSTGDKIYVLLFTQKVESEVRAKIRKYIQQSLQSKMDVEINN